MRKSGYLLLVGIAVLVTQFRDGESFHLHRSFADSHQEKENAQNLNTSTEDGLDNIRNVNVVQQQQPTNFQTANNTTEPHRPLSNIQDDDYDDWEDAGPSTGEFVDLDAIVQPTPINLYRAPVTGLFKLADANDWVVVEHYYMDHYYFGNLGAGLTANKKYIWPA